MNYYYKLHIGIYYKDYFQTKMTDKLECCSSFRVVSQHTDYWAGRHWWRGIETLKKKKKKKKIYLKKKIIKKTKQNKQKRENKTVQLKTKSAMGGRIPDG